MMVHLFVKNMDDFARVNSIYKSFLTVNPPARYGPRRGHPLLSLISCTCLNIPYTGLLGWVLTWNMVYAFAMITSTITVQAEAL